MSTFKGFIGKGIKIFRNIDIDVEVEKNAIEMRKYCC